MDKLVVIKIGGNIINDEKKLSAFLSDFADIREKKILVHGGGKLATEIADKLGVPQQIAEGRRITDKETLKIITMVYAGYINKNLVAQLQAKRCNAIGLSGVDGDVIRAHKRSGPGIDYGFAGDIDQINTSLLHNLLLQNYCPVIAPLTHDGNGQLLNTNADTIAQEIARALSFFHEVQLVFSFEKAGVLLDAEDETTLISRVNRNSYQKLKTEKKIFAGMIPKLDNAFTALEHGVKKVSIGKAEQIIELLNGSAGTTISE